MRGIRSVETVMILAFTFKVLMIAGPAIYIFWHDRNLWEDDGCTILGGKDLVYND